MPGLETSLHLDMFQKYKRRNSLVYRLGRAVKGLARPNPIYGLEWGDPETVHPLKFVRDRYILPYVKRSHVAVEVGPGGGRWTRYMLGFRMLYLVDYHSELLEELKKNFHEANLRFIKNNGSDFPGVETGSVNYVFSFGCFVHLDAPIIEAYLKSMHRILMPGGNIVIQYSDKSKIMAQINSDFSDNTPERMRAMVLNAAFRILEEDLTTMWHSSIIRFTR
jgi:ubiquinone/menaquinone biosynthesis C-methylase UbiE